MAISTSDPIPRYGLVFYYDMYNKKSYTGPAISNFLPNGKYAGYPTYPSGWTTYNTNQYNNNTYFSIGTVTDVTNNIVTCAGHPLRTYDVVKAQSSGGGVTAGTNYLVRKWTTDTFSLYAYDSTQDAFNIFDKQANFNNDVRIAISASGFPTMWWGAPHLPNSGIMKQIIKNGFNYERRIHDCLRIHWYRPDNVFDGMAYGNQPTVTAGKTYTISFYHRAATPNIVGNTGSFQWYVSPTSYASQGFTIKKDWTKFTLTFTPTSSGPTYFYWFNSTAPAQSAFDVAEIMIYEGTGSSIYLDSGTTRSNTQSLIDLMRNYTITANKLIYNNSAYDFNFNGTDTYCSVGNLSQVGSSFTISLWLNSDSVSDYKNAIDCNYNSYSSGNIGPRLEQTNTGRLVWFLSGSTNNNVYDTFDVIPSGMQANRWYNVVITRNLNNQVSTYLNGSVVVNNESNSNGFYGTFADVVIGRGYKYDTVDKRSFSGKISIVQIYNRALTTEEVLLNFTAQRGEYGV